ncbi:MAG: ImmA/IrrE family metallo-endopeptidase [Chitinophagaceae bacterium]|nr:ImmA/IrrE family metallo-endopeptidase [Chitinophagaceae bacterium]
MITNDRQYKIIKSQIDNFQQSLAELEFSAKTVKDIHPKLFEIQKAAIESQLDDLIKEVHEYEDLKEGRIAIAEVNSLSALPLALIKARIANGFTQAELAERVGVKMQQIQRYESELYDTASVKTLMKIADRLSIKINADVQIKPIEAPENLDINNYPFKQMYQRNWFGNFSGSYNDAVVDSKNLLQRFFEIAGVGNFQYSFTRKSIRSGSTLNTFALNAWYARVLEKAKYQEVGSIYTRGAITTSWLRYLAELSSEPNGPAQAAKYLRANGIRFVLEPHLEGTFLDGAALLWENSQPIVAMTLRHDRMDNFWFVLFHELAHIHLHLSEDLTVIFDDLDVKIDGIEQEADAFALNALIPDEVWRKSLVRFNPSEEAIINQAKAMKIHPALIAGRIRRETGKYYQFTTLVAKSVRESLDSEIKGV